MNNYNEESMFRTQRGTIVIVDSGWDTQTITNDCQYGWADDKWQLILTSTRNVTITIKDQLCVGDYFELYVNGSLIGATPKPDAWGCSQTGTLSSGSFTVTLQPGTHLIKVRDAGFDGHTQEEIVCERMCPACFQVSGTLSQIPQQTRGIKIF